MNQLKRIGSLVSLIIATVVLGSCVVAPIETDPATTPATASPAASPDTRVTELPPHYPAESILLGELSSKHGTAELGPLPVSSDQIAVHVRCYGLTTLYVDIPGVAELDYDCGKDLHSPGTMDVIDVQHVDTITVRGSSENSNLWAIAVTEFIGD